MKLEKEDVEFLKLLHNSELSKKLVAFIRRFEDDLCDIRALPKDIDFVTVKWVIEQMDKNLVDNIQLQNKKKTKNPNEYQ